MLYISLSNPYILQNLRVLQLTLWLHQFANNRGCNARDSMEDGGNVVSFFCRLEVEAATLALELDLFLEDSLPQVFTILRLTKRENKEKKGGFDFKRQRLEKWNKIRVRMLLGLNNIGSFYKWKQLRRRWTILRQFP